ncbi:uncharacterized protein [Amphiura filiformis]|uniref:uncharacterized protein n=1 Tax=Amphiura filiformis TaxID=82378 RepID=UPI003B21738F
MGEGRGHADKGSHVFVLLSILVLIVGIVAAAGMVMAVLNYNNHKGDDKPINIVMERSDFGGYQYAPSPPVVIGGGSSGSGTACGKGGDIGSSNLHYDPQIWNFMMLFDTPIRQIYSNAVTNQLAGYQVDVVNEVCKIAGKNCAIMTGEFSDCFSNNHPQVALMGKWVDVCMTFSHSAARSRSVMFTRSISPAPVPVMLTRRGNPSRINPDDLRGVKVGFLQNWWADEFCLSSTADIQLQEDQISFYLEDEDLTTITNAIERGEVSMKN